MTASLACNDVAETYKFIDRFFAGDTGERPHTLGRNEMEAHIANGALAFWCVLQTQLDGLADVL